MGVGIGVGVGDGVVIEVATVGLRLALASGSASDASGDGVPEHPPSRTTQATSVPRQRPNQPLAALGRRVVLARCSAPLELQPHRIRQEPHEARCPVS